MKITLVTQLTIPSVCKQMCHSWQCWKRGKRTQHCGAKRFFHRKILLPSTECCPKTQRGQGRAGQAPTSASLRSVWCSGGTARSAACLQSLGSSKGKSCEQRTWNFQMASFKYNIIRYNYSNTLHAHKNPLTMERESGELQLGRGFSDNAKYFSVAIIKQENGRAQRAVQLFLI